MKATDKQNESKEIEIIEIEDDPTKETKKLKVKWRKKILIHHLRCLRT